MSELKQVPTYGNDRGESITPPGRDMANFHPNDTREETLRKMRTAESVMLPMDVFEKLYLGPQQPAAGHLRKTFGNPSPVALVGFLLSATPNGMILMGWRGAGGGGAALL